MLPTRLILKEAFWVIVANHEPILSDTKGVVAGNIMMYEHIINHETKSVVT